MKRYMQLLTNILLLLAFASCTDIYSGNIIYASNHLSGDRLELNLRVINADRGGEHTLFQRNESISELFSLLRESNSFDSVKMSIEQFQDRYILLTSHTSPPNYYYIVGVDPLSEVADGRNYAFIPAIGTFRKENSDDRYYYLPFHLFNDKFLIPPIFAGEKHVTLGQEYQLDGSRQDVIDFYSSFGTIATKIGEEEVIINDERLNVSIMIKFVINGDVLKTIFCDVNTLV